MNLRIRMQKILELITNLKYEFYITFDEVELKTERLCNMYVNCLILDKETGKEIEAFENERFDELIGEITWRFGEK